MHRGMSRLAAAAALCALAASLTTPTAGAAKPQRSWAQPEIKLVVGRGLMADEIRTFRPDDALTRGELDDLVAGLTKRARTFPANPAAPVTLAELDARLVRALDVADSAARFQAAARRAGLAPPSRFGAEVVARLLGLRKNHEQDAEELELAPSEPATRAEAAYSAAQILRFRGYELDSVRAAAKELALPSYTAWQARILRTAVGLIGYPYVWGGTSERRIASAPQQVRGGFDCSGFVWRVYKLETYPSAQLLGATLRGRTTYTMSSEVARGKRIPFARLAPGDVVFFGAKGARSKPPEIDHMGIYFGGGWMIHSSRFGVALAQLDGYYRERFAWARRPLAEAGLAS